MAHMDNSIVQGLGGAGHLTSTGKAMHLNKLRWISKTRTTFLRVPRGKTIVYWGSY